MLEAVREAEVRDDYVPVTVEEQVLKLQVPMDDFLLVYVPYAGDELREQLARVLFPQEAMGKNVVEELATRRVLEDDTDVLVRLNHVVETDDVGMFEGLESTVTNVRVKIATRKTRTRSTSISRSTLDIRTLESMFPRLISFTATSSPHCMCSPSLTLPNSPSPSVCRSR